ncbi:hypothetical protein Tco_1332723 [Tanacetum coccineum]
MAFSVISILSDSLEESVGMSTARVFLFGTIPTTVPATAPTADLPVIHDDTPLIPTDTPTISPIIPTIPSIAPTIRYTSPFICNDSSDSDTSNTPPSPIHDTPPVEISPSICKILPASPGLPRRPAVLVLPGQSILVGRPYRTQPNRVLQMLTSRKSVGPLPTHKLALRYSVDYSSLDHFTSDDSSQDSPLDSSSKTSSDSHSNTSSDSSSRHSSSGYSVSDSLCDLLTATFAGPSRKRRRSPTTSVPVASPVTRALSPVHADLSPPRKRIRYFDFETNFEVSSEKGYEEAELRRRDGYDTAEPVREDFPELVSADGSLEVMQRGLDIVMQELYDHMVEIPVHRVRVIESI